MIAPRVISDARNWIPAPTASPWGPAPAVGVEVVPGAAVIWQPSPGIAGNPDVAGRAAVIAPVSRTVRVPACTGASRHPERAAIPRIPIAVIVQVAPSRIAGIHAAPGFA